MKQIHERLQHYEESKPAPVMDSAAVLAQDLSEQLKIKSENGDIKELAKLLENPHVKSLLSVHDTVAQKRYDPELPPLPEYLNIEESSVKIIRLVKNKEPLGATIRRDDETGAIFVARIMRGGAADRSGLIHSGDEVKEVNGIPVDDKKPEDIIRILAQSQGAITFKVVPGLKEDASIREPKVFLRALFDYDPSNDSAIPCKEAGLRFKKGSILQIMSQEDATWWQAKLDGDANPRACLIPSKQFQERRFALRQPAATLPLQRTLSRRPLATPQPYFTDCVTLDDVEIELATEIEEDADYCSGFHLGERFSSSCFPAYPLLSWCDCFTFVITVKATKSVLDKVLPHFSSSSPFIHQPCFIWSSALVGRQSGAKHRLVVLVGPSGVGINELKRKLLISDPQHFGVTIPHTSRPKKNQESDGVEYHFISKHLFEADIHNNKFVEYGEYKGNYYGTSLDTLRGVLAKKKVCLLDVQPHAIKLLRTAEFKPFVVFVKPPKMERLRETRKNAKIISSKDDKGSARPFTEEDFQEMLNTAEIMESQYGHLFEKVIVNDDLTTAFSELQSALKRVETGTHWVPVSWTHS
ncbi:MAGUK p55 subfamily member 7 [Poecilia latipinna]|uniref:MAGUK p55 subfamily member 7 n=1 Tax=Poecilia latipinna TaxID=48699 RepID=UPI00072E4942|nr:PREDICTED: MAGUK p55 subfamily member 7 [Poecilia latipinna]